MSARILRPFLASYSTLQKSLRNSSQLDEYVYGFHSVLYALQGTRRIIHKVYVQHEHQIRAKKKETSGDLNEVVRLAEKRNIPVQEIDKGELNIMSMNRPHQGVVMLTKRLEPALISKLTNVSDNNIYSAYDASSQKTHEFKLPEYIVDERKPIPIWVALDEIQDPQNLGSILRSSYFFSIDGVVICGKNCAPLSPVVSKSSAGALELSIPYTTSNMMSFLTMSAEEGWQILGASFPSSQQLVNVRTNEPIPYIEHISLPNLITKPTILVFGNEGTGIRKNVEKCCDRLVGIAGGNGIGNENKYLVDSLNVGVAVGIMLNWAVSKTLNN